MVDVRHVDCRGTCRHRSAEECASQTHFVFPYRGVYLRHVGGDQAVADANHVLFFNQQQGYQVSHPVAGGDSSLVLSLGEQMLRELAPEEPSVRRQSRSASTSRTCASMRARRRWSCCSSIRWTTAPSSSSRPRDLSLTLVSRAIGPRTSRAPARPARAAVSWIASRCCWPAICRAAGRWPRSRAEIRGSPVYLTQVFQQVEGLPLYRYHLRLRLARALDLIAEREDLSGLAQDLGFSSHSHFSAAFQASTTA